MYYTCTVRISDDSVKEFLQEYASYSEEELEAMTSWEVQNEAREAIDVMLSNFVSDYQVFDNNTVFIGDIDQ